MTSQWAAVAAAEITLAQVGLARLVLPAAAEAAEALERQRTAALAETAATVTSGSRFIIEDHRWTVLHLS